MGSLWGLLIVGVLLFLWGYGDLVAGSHKVASKARDQLHQERLIAMEKRLPPPDGSFDEALLAYVSEAGHDALDSGAQRRRAISWAVMLILGGIGWFFATIVISGDSAIGWLRDSWSFAVIPVLLGLGIAGQALIGRRD